MLKFATFKGPVRTHVVFLAVLLATTKAGGENSLYVTLGTHEY